MKKFIVSVAAVALSLAAYAGEVKSVVFSVEPRMNCGHCEAHVIEAITPAPGVEKAETSLTNNTVTVSYDADATNAEALKAAFANAGYTVTLWDGTVPSPNGHQCSGECEEEGEAK